LKLIATPPADLYALSNVQQLLLQAWSEIAEQQRPTAELPNRSRG
jgi:hypothetical protein